MEAIHDKILVGLEEYFSIEKIISNMTQRAGLPGNTQRIAKAKIGKPVQEGRKEGRKERGKEGGREASKERWMDRRKVRTVTK